MRVDMHTHCRPISRCALLMPEELPEIFLQNDIDAIVLTNHCYPLHCDPLSSDLNEQAKIFVDTYNLCKTKGEKVGLKVFFGVEVKLINEPNKPEFLLYGLSIEDFLSSYPLYNLSQKELYDFCNEKNILMVQAHPYRLEQGYSHADMKYLHGIEVYNSHPQFEPNYARTLDLAERYNKIKTSGTDFHGKDQAGLSGMIIPDDIEDQFMLRDYLCEGESIIFSKDKIIYSFKNE